MNQVDSRHWPRCSDCLKSGVVDSVLVEIQRNESMAAPLCIETVYTITLKEPSQFQQTTLFLLKVDGGILFRSKIPLTVATFVQLANVSSKRFR